MLKAYTSTLSKILKPRTVIFLIKDNKVLLGYKKSGFGKGYYVGIGGKVNEDEKIEEAAVRELKEEINVDLLPTNLKKVAILKFYFPHIKDESWNQEVHAYLVSSWKGEPNEKEEIKPVWFDKDKLPLGQMWEDAKYWIPDILNDKNVFKEFIFDKELKVVEHQNFKLNIFKYGY